MYGKSSKNAFQARLLLQVVRAQQIAVLDLVTRSG
jgi:hypothetical protein